MTMTARKHPAIPRAARKKERHWDIYMFIAIYLNITLIVDLVRQFGSNYFPPLYANIELIRNAAYVVILAGALLTMRKKVPIFVIVVLVGELALILYSMLMVPKAQPIFTQYLMMFFSRMLPGFILLYNHRDYEKLVDRLLRLWPVAVVYTVLSVIWTNTDNYMGFAYNIYVFSTFYLLCGLYRKHRGYLAVGALLTFALFMWGARGASLSEGVAVLAYLILNPKNKRVSRRMILLIVLVVIFLVVYLLYFERLVTYLYVQFPNARTIRKLYNGVFTNNSGRDDLYSALLTEFAQHPFAVRGILADRITLGDLRHGSVYSLNAYAHNLIVEILYQHGLIIGGGIIAALAFILLRSGRICRQERSGSAFLIWVTLVPLAFTQLMVSSSYLTNYMFAAAVSLMAANAGVVRLRQGPGRGL